MLGERAESHPLNAASAAVTARETISRKPIATTRPNERKRSITNASRFTPGFGLTRQIVFSAAWSSRNAPVAATTKAMLPTTVATYPSSSLTRSLKKTLHRVRAFAADELIELAHNLPADGLGAEGHARDRGGDEQDGRERKQRVVRE